MGEQWKPGDVAVVTGEWHRGRTSDARAVRVESGWEELGVGAFVHESQVVWVRPLALVDPEDVHALREIVQSANFHMPGEIITPSVNKLRAALREFARPTPPKPEEPQGLGAVVKDASGNRWVRSQWQPDDETPWVNAGDYGWRGWADLNVPDEAHILSHGIAEADR